MKQDNRPIYGPLYPLASDEVHANVAAVLRRFLARMAREREATKRKGAK